MSSSPLTRLGNKRRIAGKIIPHFPQHTIYVEPFFGGGGMFFSKPKAEQNVLNDLDGEVYNLFRVILSDREAFRRAWEATPIDARLWEAWRKGEPPADPVLRAARFILLSNFGYMGKPQTLRYLMSNAKQLVLDRLDDTWRMKWDCEFSNADFRQLFRKLPFKSDSQRRRAFIYADPPYLDCTHNYSSGFVQQDSADLVETLQGTGCRWAMSEFDHPFILQQANERGLRVIEIGERKNLGNRRMELLITNYDAGGVLLS